MWKKGDGRSNSSGKFVTSLNPGRPRIQPPRAGLPAHICGVPVIPRETPAVEPWRGREAAGGGAVVESLTGTLRLRTKQCRAPVRVAGSSVGSHWGVRKTCGSQAPSSVKRFFTCVKIKKGFQKELCSARDCQMVLRARLLRMFEEVIQIEVLCKQLYESQDPAVRDQAEKAVVAFQESPDTLSKCQALLERADSSYSQLLAATTLAKLINRSTTSLSIQQRLDIRNYVLNYLATRPKLANFVIQSLVSLFARITKLSWFDMLKEEFVFHNVMNDVGTFLQGPAEMCTVGVQLLSQLVVEMNQVTEADANRSLAKHRKIASSFRDTQLFEMFRLACSLLGTARVKPLDLSDECQHSLIASLLRLAHNCLTFDFIGTTSDECSDDLCTVQAAFSTSSKYIVIQSRPADTYQPLACYPNNLRLII
ncbi:hypothetical protein evm_012889 [Chilo suppressalis]|nr:hypothetical protein evm_012889 [Chilo suppressalis]